MLSAFIVWLTEYWDLIVDVFMWSVSLLMVLILLAKVYKIIKFKFEPFDIVGLLFGTLWILLIIVFGFNHMGDYLKSFF